MPRAFAVSDLHGCKFLYEQICNFLEPDDIVYCLGDCNDRGPNPWELVKLIRANPQWIYIKGNHEQLLEDWAWSYLINNEHDDIEAWRLQRNGGVSTIEDFLADEAKSGDKDFIASWVKYLAELPYVATYESAKGTIYMSHSGHIDYRPHLNRESKKRLLLWDREHFRNVWDNSQEQYDYVIHGHTPIPYVMEEVNGIYPEVWVPGVFWYCDDHKCCIDNASFHSGFTCLLDLNTFDEHIFSMNMEENENG